MLVGGLWCLADQECEVTNRNPDAQVVTVPCAGLQGSVVNPGLCGSKEQQSLCPWTRIDLGGHGKLGLLGWPGVDP